MGMKVLVHGVGHGCVNCQSLLKTDKKLELKKKSKETEEGKEKRKRWSLGWDLVGFETVPVFSSKGHIYGRRHTQDEGVY